MTASAKQAEKERQKKSLHTAHAFAVNLPFWQKKRIPHTTRIESLVKLQAAINGDEILRGH